MHWYWKFWGGCCGQISVLYVDFLKGYKVSSWYWELLGCEIISLEKWQKALVAEMFKRWLNLRLEDNNFALAGKWGSDLKLVITAPLQYIAWHRKFCKMFCKKTWKLLISWWASNASFRYKSLHTTFIGLYLRNTATQSCTQRCKQPCSACQVFVILLGLSVLVDNRESYKDKAVGVMHRDRCSIVLSSFSYYRRYIGSLPLVSLKNWPWEQNCCQQSMSYKQTETSHCVKNFKALNPNISFSWVVPALNRP